MSAGHKKYRAGAAWACDRSNRPFDFIIMGPATNGRPDHRLCAVRHRSTHDRRYDLEGDYSLRHLRRYAVFSTNVGYLQSQEFSKSADRLRSNRFKVSIGNLFEGTLAQWENNFGHMSALDDQALMSEIKLWSDNQGYGPVTIEEKKDASAA